MARPRPAPGKRPREARGRSTAAGPAAAADPARISPFRLPRRLAPRKRPAQARARETVEAILEAAVELFSSRGYARTSTNHLAARAGVSVGSLYQYFPNKDAILTALLARHLEAVHDAVAASLPVLADPAVPVRAGVRGLLERLRAVHEADPRLARAVEQQAGQMPSVPAGLAAHRHGTVERIAGILGSRPDVRSGNHALMAALLGEVTEAVSGFLVHGPREAFGREELLDEAVEAVARYVER
ncbi:MAG TPA: helix-turn-helix domain-containing protein [Thermoanaerobaculia bacterium]|nr:helix-turn-helix domain-containing protein [Thermoanaerobaculia bacterium]HQN06017.1 helix-turn-helix domain-containing protein [Thermoanaerobaculia bacterium]HQP85034.1 helix-turn-helix domain-containing protein [Thermoanaerobaculia bacterium]